MIHLKTLICGVLACGAVSGYANQTSENAASQPSGSDASNVIAKEDSQSELAAKYSYSGDSEEAVTPATGPTTAPRSKRPPPPQTPTTQEHPLTEQQKAAKKAQMQQQQQQNQKSKEVQETPQQKEEDRKQHQENVDSGFHSPV